MRRFPAEPNNIDQLIAVLDTAVSNSELNNELSPLSSTAAK